MTRASNDLNVNESSAAQDGTPREVTLDEIAARAYEIYQSRGGTDGADLDDWLQAERELRSSESGRNRS